MMIRRWNSTMLMRDTSVNVGLGGPSVLISVKPWTSLYVNFIYKLGNLNDCPSRDNVSNYNS